MARASSTKPLSRKQKTGRLAETLKADYRRYHKDKAANPFYSPVLRQAVSINDDIQSGAITADDIAGLIRAWTGEAAQKRCGRLAAYMGSCDESENLAGLEALITSLCYRGRSSKPVDFDTFRDSVERLYYNFVFTAHPTFTMTRPFAIQMAERAAGIAGAHLKQHGFDPAAQTEKPFLPPGLREENLFSLEAIGNLHHAVGQLYGIVFDIARKAYPGRWTELRPKLFGISTWVGFDLDGRNDISWGLSLANRIYLNILQLEDYLAQFEKIAKKLSSREAEKITLLLTATIADLKTHHAFFDAYTESGDAGYKNLQRESKKLVAGTPKRLIHPEKIVAPLEKLLAETKNPALQKELAVLLSRLNHFGLARAQVHFRINAVQLHNAIRKHVNLTSHPADPRYRQAYLDSLLALFAHSPQSTVNFGDIMDEKASAKKLFMLIQEITRHIDAYSPVRFLIAETESAFTVLTALFFARRFGVENLVEISPLFETETALAQGSRIVEQLLELPPYATYLQGIRRLCIQTGYSDAGRYIGQTPADGSIERLKERLVGLFEDKPALAAVKLVVFDTHGESIGRGGHPGGFLKRMAYLASAHFLSLVEKSGIRYLQESSYQGGDGFLPFMTKAGGLAALTRVATYWLGDGHGRTVADPAYSDRAGATEFFTIVKEFQGGLMKDSDYGILLSSFGPNLLPPMGSRAVKRQHEGRGGDLKHQEAREFRAIPHNAILLQMGLLANSVSGLGHAVAADPDYFDEMIRKSPRFRLMMELVERGMELSDPEYMKAYIDTQNPMIWLMRQSACGDRRLAAAYGEIAAALERSSPFTQLTRIFRKLFADFALLRQSASFGSDRLDDDRVLIGCLHALRVALIMRLQILAMSIPDYSPQHDLPRALLIRHVFRLDVPMAVKELRDIFPVKPNDPGQTDYGESSTYNSEDNERYGYENRYIFDPMLRTYESIVAVSHAIGHAAGFSG